MDGNPYPHNPGPLTGDIPQQFQQHEERSQQRYEMLSEQLKSTVKENKMGLEGVSDKVNINLGDMTGGRGDSGAGLAAVIAALGNRNEGGDTAGLIAALGNRNNDGGIAALLPALMANNNNGMNNLWPIILLALLGRGRGGLLGGDGDCAPGGVSPGQAALLQTLLEGQSDLRADVPRTALETQNAIQSAIASLALGTQQGFANTKDAVQNGISFLDRDIQMTNQNVSAQGCQTREWVANDGDKTRVAIAALENRVNAIQENNLQRELAVAQAALAEERGVRRSRDVEINVSQQVNQQQAQQQQQQQFNEVLARMRCLEQGHNQIATAVNRTIQFGTGNVAANTNTANNAQ